MTSYTIKEICKAWEKFNNPKWIVRKLTNGDDEINQVFDPLKEAWVNPIEKLNVDYSKWISYLVSEEWK